ncbi:hypothetical protein FOCC_FOCC012669 [Frankliniella occidentalis]|nr:hypothetical protein FOCC_FOCC012669 [Frankliniella occidentalis]
MPPANNVEIKNIVGRLKVNVSAGFDEIRPGDIKLLAENQPEVITDLVNKSIEEGAVPDELKVSICCPIYKKGSHLESVNYRPVCEQSVMSKIIESYIATKVRDYAIENNFISQEQYAYQEKKGTETLLCNFASPVNSELHKGKHVICLFIDFSKAFDTVNHKILLEKLHAIGVREHAKMEKSNKAAARKYEVTPKIVRDWRKQEAELLNACSTRRSFRGPKSGKWPELERQLVKWVHDVRGQLCSVSKKMVQREARNLAKDLGMNGNTFKASLSWIDRVMKRNGLIIRRHTTIAQRLPNHYEEKLVSFQR